MTSGMDVLLLAHGSKSPDYRAAYHAFADAWQRLSNTPAQMCFLEQCEPLLEDALDEHVAQSRSVLILPLLLHAGVHSRQDIPDRVIYFRQRHPEMKLRLANGLIDMEVIARALYDRATRIRADMQAIILLTHGSRQDETREKTRRLAGMLAQYAGVEVQLAFSGYGSPSLADMLTQQAGRGDVVIVPHFLFSGRWRNRARADIEAFQCAYPETVLNMAEPLGAHPVLLRLLLQQWAGTEDAPD